MPDQWVPMYKWIPSIRDFELGISKTESRIPGRDFKIPKNRVKYRKNPCFWPKLKNLKNAKIFKKIFQFFFEIWILFLFFPFIFALNGIILTLEQILVSEGTFFSQSHFYIFGPKNWKCQKQRKNIEKWLFLQLPCAGIPRVSS